MARSGKGTIHRLYWIGLTIKGLNGLLELLAGLLLPFMSVELIRRFVQIATEPAITEDPDDLIANALRGGAEHLSSGSKTFAVVYLIGHGVIKLGLVVALLRHKRWAFPWALGFLGLFVIYQSYHAIHKESWPMGAAAILDIGVVVLVWNEYRRESSSSSK